MDWSTYYDNFYHWADSTRISHLSKLTSFGPADEIIEIAEAFFDEKIASRLVKKAVAFGVVFSAEEICELNGLCNTAAMNALLNQAKCNFTQEQLEELCGCADDTIINRLAAQNGVTLFHYPDNELEAVVDIVQQLEEMIPVEPKPKSPKFPFFKSMVILTGLIRIFQGNETRRSEQRCEDREPHYGYRYGRWYYGNGHTYGCESDRK